MRRRTLKVGDHVRRVRLPPIWAMTRAHILMRRQAGYVAILVVLAGGAIGCAAEAGRTATQPSAQTKPAVRVIELGRQTLTFTPTRDDLTVRCAVLDVLSSHPVRIN